MSLAQWFQQAYGHPSDLAPFEQLPDRVRRNSEAPSGTVGSQLTRSDQFVDLGAAEAKGLSDLVHREEDRQRRGRDRVALRGALALAASPAFVAAERLIADAARTSRGGYVHDHKKESWT